jgi:hypothetical protein
MSLASSAASAASVAASPSYAYVALVMKGDAYIPGALVAAASLRNTKTRHALVCMVTPDVTATGREALAQVFDRVIQVDYLQGAVRRMATSRQQDMYKRWMDVSFTKWRALTLVDYAKVLFVDADKVVLTNVDHLFDLPAPAGTFSSPWSKPFIALKQEMQASAASASASSVSSGSGPSSSGPRRSGFYNPYEGRFGIRHGQTVSPKDIEASLHQGGVVVVGTMVLLKPSSTDFQAFQDMLRDLTRDGRLFGFDRCKSMMDEQAITWFYLTCVRKTWTYIAPKYNYIPWQRHWINDHTVSPSVYHYFNTTKPWQTKRSEWADLDVWWKVALNLVATQPALASFFNIKELGAPSETLCCCWCKSSYDFFRTKRPDAAAQYADFAQHAMLDDQGIVSCPRMPAPCN